LYTRRLHQAALLAGWGAGMAVGTMLVVHGGFSHIVPIPIGGHVAQLYAGLVALVVNLMVAGVLAVVLDRLGVPRRENLTATAPRRAPVSGPDTGGVTL